MKFVRFSKDIYSDMQSKITQDEIVWRKKQLYKVIYEDFDKYYVESDSIEYPEVGISKINSSTICVVYNCDFTPSSICVYCKHSLQDNEKQNCGIEDICNPHINKEESNLKSVKILNDDLIVNIERDIAYDR